MSLKMKRKNMSVPFFQSVVFLLKECLYKWYSFCFISKHNKPDRLYICQSSQNDQRVPKIIKKLKRLFSCFSDVSSYF